MKEKILGILLTIFFSVAASAITFWNTSSIKFAQMEQQIKYIERDNNRLDERLKNIENGINEIYKMLIEYRRLAQNKPKKWSTE